MKPLNENFVESNSVILNEVSDMLEQSIEEHNLAKLKYAIELCGGSIYSRVSYAGPLFYAAENDFTEGVEFLLDNHYGIVLGPVEIDRLWKTALFGYPKKGKSIVMLLLEYKLLPSESFLCSLSFEIRKEKELTRNRIISYLREKMPDIVIDTCYNDADQIIIEEKAEN